MISEKARQARNEYVRRWRKENPERVAQITARYWERKAAEFEKSAETKQEAKTDKGADCQADNLVGNTQS